MTARLFSRNLSRKMTTNKLIPVLVACDFIATTAAEVLLNPEYQKIKDKNKDLENAEQFHAKLHSFQF